MAIFNSVRWPDGRRAQFWHDRGVLALKVLEFALIVTWIWALIANGFNMFVAITLIAGIVVDYVAARRLRSVVRQAAT